jgi:hypothetical protein
MAGISHITNVTEHVTLSQSKVTQWPTSDMSCRIQRCSTSTLSAALPSLPALVNLCLHIPNLPSSLAPPSHAHSLCQHTRGLKFEAPHWIVGTTQ